MSKVTGRRDDMLVLRGVNVYPSEVERVLLAAPALCPDYLLVVDEREAAGRLIVCCEYKTAAASDPAPAGAADSAAGRLPGPGDLESRLRAELGVSVAVRVVRWRDGAPPLPGLGAARCGAGR
jgi:phenylacetate-CoA ligase